MSRAPPTRRGPRARTVALVALTRLAATCKFARLGLACAGLGALAWRTRVPLVARLACAASGLVALSGALGVVAPRPCELGAAGVAMACATVTVDAAHEIFRRRE